MTNHLKKFYLPTQQYIEFVPNIYLKAKKIHEVCGPAKMRMVTFIASKTKGLIVWIRPDWNDLIINTDSISDWFSPNQLLLINAKSKNDLFFGSCVLVLLLKILLRIPLTFHVIILYCSKSSLFIF